MGEIKIGDKALVEMNVVGWDKITGDYQMRPEEDNRTFWASERMVHTAEKTYEDGLREAWELARRIICNTESGGLHMSELKQIFGYSEFDDVLKNYTPQEAAAKIAEWENRQDIHVGDLVRVGFGYQNESFCLNCLCEVVGMTQWELYEKMLSFKEQGCELF